MTQFRRVFVIVLDSVGIGQALDAQKYDDEGADTLGHIGSGYQGHFELKNLQKLGLSNIRPENPITNVPIAPSPLASFGKMQELSVGKDSMDGHFEMMGLPVTEPLGFFPDGFDDALIKKIEDYSGRKVIVNKPYSGTEVIEKYGEHQLETGDLIVYTSGDSVLQIAANTAVMPLEELHDLCRYVRSITIDAPYRIGRVIARPYVGTNKDNFERTSDRHDYALLPEKPTDLDRLKEAGYEVIAVGKTEDIFSGQGITEGFHTTSNRDGMDKVIELSDREFRGFLFANLVDFDAMYGHRRNIQGYGDALMDFDRRLGELLPLLKEDDLLMITADHGNDPGFKGTDHTREFVPLLAYSPSLIGSQDLGTRQTFSDLGQTILDNFEVKGTEHGTSFLNQLK